jgi:hypothetical protein
VEPDECEMCGRQIGPSSDVPGRIFSRWHQTEPVERWLCGECGKEDQRATHPRRWIGKFFPTVWEPGHKLALTK